LSNDSRFRGEETSNPPVIIGVSSLLVVFSVLCLTVFAMLSLMTVQADKRLLQTSVSTIEARAEADAKAQEILSKLRAGKIPAGVKSALGEGLFGSGAEIPEGMPVYTYSCPVTENAHLEVAVAVNGSDYRILRWQEVSDIEWESDDSIDVWQEDFFGGFGALPDF